MLFNFREGCLTTSYHSPDIVPSYLALQKVRVSDDVILPEN